MILHLLILWLAAFGALYGIDNSAFLPQPRLALRGAVLAILLAVVHYLYVP